MSQVPPDPGWPPRTGQAWTPPPPVQTGWSTVRVVTLSVFGALLLMGALGAGLFALGPEGAGVLFDDSPRRDPAGEVVDPGMVDKDDLRPGDCINDHALRRLEPGGELDASSDFVEVVPCGGWHDFEVTASFFLPGQEYDDQKAVQRDAQRGCFQRIREGWAGDRRLLRDKMLAFYMPLHDTPRRDKVVCLLQLASGDRMTGRIR